MRICERIEGGWRVSSLTRINKKDKRGKTSGTLILWGKTLPLALRVKGKMESCRPEGTEKGKGTFGSDSGGEGGEKASLVGAILPEFIVRTNYVQMVHLANLGLEEKGEYTGSARARNGGREMYQGWVKNRLAVQNQGRPQGQAAHGARNLKV